MSADENKAIVRRFFADVFNARTLDVADDLFAPDHIYTDPSTPGALPGPRGVKDTVATYHTGFSDAHWIIDELIADADTVVVRWTARGTHDGMLPGIPATGKQVTVPGIWIYHFADGKIAASWNVWDTLGMLQQLGVIPAPGQAQEAGA